MTKRFGFTLAEVLITLGIIGVVAAMTIPTLVSNTQGAQFKTAYKKALSSLNQAVLMNLALEDTDLSTVAADASATGTVGFGYILGQRMKGANPITTYPTDANDAKTPVLTQTDTIEYNLSCTGNEPPEAPEGATAAACVDGVSKITGDKMSSTAADYAKVALADGTAFWYHKDANNCTDVNAVANKCYGFIDVNGITGPNRITYCTNGASGKCEASEINDMFPVFFHGQTIEPATDSARAVLFGK